LAVWGNGYRIPEIHGRGGMDYGEDNSALHRLVSIVSQMHPQRQPALRWIDLAENRLDVYLIELLG
jgi:hypothetical protein